MIKSLIKNYYVNFIKLQGLVCKLAIVFQRNSAPKQWWKTISIKRQLKVHIIMPPARLMFSLLLSVDFPSLFWFFLNRTPKKKPTNPRSLSTDRLSQIISRSLFSLSIPFSLVTWFSRFCFSLIVFLSLCSFGGERGVFVERERGRERRQRKELLERAIATGVLWFAMWLLPSSMEWAFWRIGFMTSMVMGSKMDISTVRVFWIWIPWLQKEGKQVFWIWDYICFSI